MRIKDLTSATSPTSGDYIAVDNATNGTRKTYARQVIKVTGTISGSTTTVSKTGITADMEVIDLVLGTTSAITAPIGWQTLSGQLKLTTTVATNQSSTFVAYLSEVR